MAYYLYSLCHKEVAPKPSPSWPGGVNPSGKFSFVCSGPLAGLVQAVNLCDFGAKAFKQNLQCPDWVAEKVRAHDEVVRYLFERVDAVVPVRFGAVFKTKKRIARLLDEGAETILADLMRLRGTAEWGVKVYARERQFLKGAEITSGGSKGRNRGIEYLRKKQRQEQLAHQMREWIRKQVNNCHQLLHKLGREYRIKPCQGNENDERVVLNSVYLVDRSVESEWLKKVETFNQEWSNNGLRLVISGPWPPYTFVTPIVMRDEPDE